jgi:hypothetical protein
MKPNSSNALQPAMPESPVRKGFRRVGLVVLHGFILLAVLLIPPLTYDFVSASPWSDNEFLLFVGALSWPLYAISLSLKCRGERLRFVLVQAIFVLTAMAVSAKFARCQMSDAQTIVVLLAPLLVAALPAPLLIQPGWRRLARFRKLWLLISLSCMPFALGYIGLMIYGAAMCAMSGMRW